MGSFSEPRSVSPLATPPGWSCHVNSEGQTLYTNQFTQEQVGAEGRWAQTAPGSLLQLFVASSSPQHHELRLLSKLQDAPSPAPDPPNPSGLWLEGNFSSPPVRGSRSPDHPSPHSG